MEGLGGAHNGTHDEAILQQLQSGHGHDAHPMVDTPGITSLARAMAAENVDLAGLLDPDLMMDQEAARIMGEFASHAGFDHGMDLDDVPSHLSAPCHDEAEDIGHSLQTTLIGHMKYMGML